MMLMTLLYSARAARFELFQAINYLAKRITRWDSLCDKRMHRLMCYISSHVDDKLVGWIGDHPSLLSCHLFADANFAGCPYTLKSTGGEHLNIQGPNSRFAYSASSSGQTALAQSTPEAELGSLNSAMKSKGEPALDIWPTLLAQYHEPDWKFQVFLHEDNTTCITCVRTGANKTMKTLERNFGVSIGWCHDRVESLDYVLIHTRTSHMAADIYTKGFRAPDVWIRLRRLINVYTIDEIKNFQFSPEHSSYSTKDVEDVVVDSNDLNPHYTYIMSGESVLNTDFRKPVKTKSPKKKPAKKPKSAAVVSCDGLHPDWKPIVSNPGGTIAVLDNKQIKQRAPELLWELPCSFQYHVVLVCTEPNSYMSQCNPFPNNCTVHHITLEDDFTSKSGYRKVADLVKYNAYVALMVSFPCVGGCLFNAGINAKNPKCQAKLVEHRALFELLWRQLVKLFREFGELPIIHEWPRHCTYWKDPLVASFVKKYGLSLTDFDGCQVGLKSCLPNEKDLFLKKPWRFGSNIPDVSREFRDLLCPGISEKHIHGITCGKNAKSSQYYTPYMTTLVHVCVFRYFYDIHHRGILALSSSPA